MAASAVASAENAVDLTRSVLGGAIFIKSSQARVKIPKRQK
jgi:hypothetical protein